MVLQDGQIGILIVAVAANPQESHKKSVPNVSTGPANLLNQLFQLYFFEKIKSNIGNITNTGSNGGDPIVFYDACSYKLQQ